MTNTAPLATQPATSQEGEGTVTETVKVPAPDTQYAAIGETSTVGPRWYIWKSGPDNRYVAGKIADQAQACAIADELNRLAATPTPPTLSEDLRAAVAGIADDYMTSDAHRHGCVLIPIAKFEEIAALARAQVKAS